jgi:hypothetical protein
VNTTKRSTGRSLAQKTAATIAVLAVAATLELFVTTASFEGSHDPFTTSVVARP